jgi:hypothetical protein
MRLLRICPVLALLASVAQAQTADVAGIAEAVPGPAAVPVVPTASIESLEALDSPNDPGGALDLYWTFSDEGLPPDSIRVLRSTGGEGAVEVGWILPGTDFFTDDSLENGTTYLYTLETWSGGVLSGTSPEAAGVPSAQWFHSRRIGMFVITVLLASVIFWYIERGRKGKTLYIREIAGLSAVEEAVGRATEMGRPVLYIPGIMDMDDIQTIASMVILGRVASKTAEYGANLLVPNTRSVVMSVAQEVVKEAYLQMGRPDAYRRENINYLTDDQFGYAAGVDGIMVRQRPAAIFLLGTFYAESLILAETGKSVGAIQIAGTAMVSQLPFFIAACDYTLIGEELFAASAYLSHEPKLLGSLKGQDAAKLVIMILIILGVTAASAGYWWEPAGKVADFIRFLTHVE